MTLTHDEEDAQAADELERRRAKIHSLEIQIGDLQKLLNESRTAIERMKQALRRHHCSEPNYHLKDLRDLQDTSVWVP